MMNNLKYEITIYWSETDEAFIAEVPELAGCMADGETYDEALTNAQIVINQWIETAISLKRPVPKPKNRFSFA
jgi:predicted RNase H-like HicB family nuclease